MIDSRWSIRIVQRLVFILLLVLMQRPNSIIHFANGQPTIHQEDNEKVPFLEGDPNFLFLGNSYTSFNNLAGLVKNLLEVGVPTWNGHVRVQSRDPGGARFTGHLKHLERHDKSNHLLRQWPWKWVCLQEQSQIPGFSMIASNDDFTESLSAVQTLNHYIQANGAQTLLLVTWGRRNGDSQNPQLFPDFMTMQHHLTHGYQRYAAAIGTERPAFMAPAGLVFETIYNDLVQQGKDPTQKGSLFYKLYTKDGSHPSLAGSYLAALTIYTTITGHNPKEVRYRPPTLDRDICWAIQDAVHRTILQTYESGTIKYPWTLPWPDLEGRMPSSEEEAKDEL